MPSFSGGIPGWRILQLVEVGEAFGTRVSDLLEMKEAGYSPAERLELDAAFVSFANRFRRERDALVSVWEKPEKPPGKRLVRVQKPKNSRDTLLGFLGIDPREVDGSEDLRDLAAAAGVDSATWEALPDYPDEEE